VNDAFESRPVLVCYDDRGGTAVIFDRTVDGKAFTFDNQNGQLTDRETGTHWDRVSGKGLTGPLASRSLRLLPGVVSLHNAWATFHGKSTYWLPPEHTDSSYRWQTGPSVTEQRTGR